MGIFPANVSRIKQLDESLSIIKAMWKDKCRFFEGKYYRIIEATSKPIQKPHPIIMVGGSSERYLLQVVAKHADGYNLFFGIPNEMKTKISLLGETIKKCNILLYCRV